VSLSFDALPILLPSEQRAELEDLGVALRLVAAQATASAQAAEAAAPGTCLHCGGPTSPGATLCDGCDCSGDGCSECYPLDEDAT